MCVGRVYSEPGCWLAGNCSYNQEFLWWKYLWFDGCGGDDPHGNFFFDLDFQIRLKLSGSAKSNKEKEIRVSLKAPNPLISSHKV